MVTEAHREESCFIVKYFYNRGNKRTQRKLFLLVRDKEFTAGFAECGKNAESEARSLSYNLNF